MAQLSAGLVSHCWIHSPAVLIHPDFLTVEEGGTCLGDDCQFWSILIRGRGRDTSADR